MEDILEADSEAAAPEVVAGAEAALAEVEAVVLAEAEPKVIPKLLLIK